VLIGSGEHYGAILNLDFDFRRYFPALARDGLNHTRTFSGTYREDPTSFGITDNTLAPKPHRYLAPWARSDQPGYAGGGNKFDLTRFDPQYFERLKEFLSCAAEHNVIVEMNLFCPLYDDRLWELSPMNIRNNVNGIGDCPRTEVLTLKHPKLVEVQTAFVRRLVEEINAFENFYYEVCNEPYFGGVTMEWQHRMVDTIVEKERDLPKKHLISMNIANGSARVEHPHPAVSIFNFHYCVPPDAVAMNQHLNKVIGENETGFRGPEDVLYRTEAWDFILAGGALFSHLDYSFTCSHPGGTFTDYKSPGGGSPELRRQFGILKRFIESFDFIRMKPFQEAIAKVEGKLTYRVLAEPGKAYAIYLHVPLPNKPKKLEEHLRKDQQVGIWLRLPAGQYQVEWLDPVSGATLRSENIEHSAGDCRLVSPPFDNDVALKLLRKG